MDEKNLKFGRGGVKFSVTKSERAMEFFILLKDECVVGAGFDARDKDVGAKSLERRTSKNQSRNKILSTEKLRTIREEVMTISETDRAVEQKEVAKEMPSMKLITARATIQRRERRVSKRQGRASEGRHQEAQEGWTNSRSQKMVRKASQSWENSMKSSGARKTGDRYLLWDGVPLVGRCCTTSIWTEVFLSLAGVPLFGRCCAYL